MLLALLWLTRMNHDRYLEQYRTDSIFRIMGLKAHVKVGATR